MPVTQLTNPSGAFGFTANAEGTGLTYDVYVSGESTTTISKGQPCEMNTSGKILQSTTTVARKVIGIALQDIAAGKAGPVAISGLVTLVACESGVAAGDLLSQSGSTAGKVNTLASAAGTQGQGIGVAMTAASSGTCTVFLKST